MSVLSQKLQEASKLFQTHQFKKSLEAYEECLKFAYNTEECQSVIHNILSTKASLQYILGQYTTALTTINEVLRKDPYHFLCLMRRSQVYKKTNKLKRSLKDLQKIFVFCPDNLQVSALKVQIEHMILKQNRQNETSSSEDQEEEEQSINFMRLKSIDRRSSQASNIKSRKSRVTILGDTTFEYKTQQIDVYKEQTEDIKDKAVRTYKQIELDSQSNLNEEQMPVINIKAPKPRGKSILKNKATSIFIHNEDKQDKLSKYLGKQSKLLDKIKNIDGKFIPSSQSIHNSSHYIKEVQFRKSVSQPAHLLGINNQNIQTKSNASSKRKSCLKHPSFEIMEKKEKKIRLSKFESIDASKIDGHILSKHIQRKSIQGNYLNKDDINEQRKENIDSDNQDSSHNIFGSKQYVLTSDLKLKLGISQDILAHHDVPKLKNKKSILKKNSSVAMSSFSPQKGKNQSPFSLFSTMSRQQGQNYKNSGKKSVMFSCTL